MTLNAVNDRSGMVINPKYSTYFVVHDIPKLHESPAGMMPVYRRL
jgi:hypothetical protein